jgi:hypothetical protein
MWTWIFMDKLRYVNIHFDQNMSKELKILKEIPLVKWKLLSVWKKHFFRWTSKTEDKPLP